MKLIYVAGKYRADTEEGIDENIAKARAVAINLWKSGWAVICPHSNTSKMPVDEEKIINGDIEMLKRCDAIYMMDEWWESEGATREFMFALNHNIDMFNSPQSQEMIDKIIRESPDPEEVLDD